MTQEGRGRPRDRTIDDRVLAAAVEELAENGIARFSVRAVATRAGVDRRSVVARWAGTDDLIVDALAGLTARLQPPLTGTLRGDLQALLPPIAGALSDRWRQVLQRCLDEVAAPPGGSSNGSAVITWTAVPLSWRTPSTALRHGENSSGRRPPGRPPKCSWGHCCCGR